MKRWVIVTIFTLAVAFYTSSASAHKYFSEDSLTPLDSYCEKCSEEVKVEEEIKEHFKETPVFVSLDECIGVALNNNFNIKVSASTYKSADYDFKNALAQFLPNVTLQGYTIYYNGQVLVGAALVEKFDELALSGTILVQHDLTDGGRQIFEAKAAKLRARAGLKSMDHTINDVILNTAVEYYRLLEYKISIEVYLKNLYERTAQLKLTETQWKAGVGTKFDVIRSKSEQAQAEQKLMIALNDFRVAQARLANVMGIEVNTALIPIEIEAKEYNLVDESLSIEELFEIAKNSRNDVKSQENTIKSMRQDKLAIYTEFFPHARIFYQNQYQGTARLGVYPNNVLGAYLDIPIGDRLGVGTVMKAKALQSQIDARCYSLTQLLRDIKESIVRNFYNSIILKDRIGIAKRQVEYASDSVRLAELRMEAGEGILIDVIQAQTLKTNARIELLTTIMEYNINQIRLLYDNGTISFENITKNYSP